MRLTVETGPLAGTVVSLVRDQPTLLGSDPECAIRIQEAGVAPQQAVVKALRDQGFGIKALAPGVRVNGAVVEASPLKDGDVIELGTTRIAFGQLQKRGTPNIAGYRVIEELGRGGMGYVFRAEQVSLHREVALKVLNRELTKDANFVAKFVAEARAAAKLQHPNVVQVFDVDHDGETYYYAMELMHEGSLEDWLKQNGTMPVDRALRVVADAAAGLAYAESLGMVHRDIKPDNLMLDQHGAVKIADLGLAGTGEEVEASAIGTPHFMAPEQVLKKTIDHRTDLYALGCTFYRLVTGRTPFRGQAVKDILRAQVKDEAEPANKVNSAVPVEVATIIQRLMAKDPQQRFQNANDLLEELGVLLRPPAKKGLWIGLALAGVVVAGIAISWAMNKAKEKEYVEVEKRYDDPEKQQFADEIKLLKKEAREARGTIALLTARTSGVGGGELAAVFDRIATEHAGTQAAAEATQRANDLRREHEELNRRTELRRMRVDEHVTMLRQAIRSQLEAHDYGLACGALDAPVPADLQNDADLTRRVQEVRDEVLAKARERLRALSAPLSSKDEPALLAATEALATALPQAGAWPAALAAELSTAKEQLATARATLGDLSRSRNESMWRQYRTMVTANDGMRRHLIQHAYAAAADCATRFASANAATPTGERAQGLAAAAQLAEGFVNAFARAASAGQIQITLPNAALLQVVRWDREQAQLVLAEPNKKPAKETVVPTSTVSLESWTTLAEQVTTGAPGERDCFLGLFALAIHGEAASSYLGQLRADDDQSGTGSAAYPHGANLFEALARRLPEADTQPWVKVMRDELQAGFRLASGLRALSERRNLAAATHVEKLLSEHSHSYLVSLLP